MSYPTKRIIDVNLALAYAQKFYGKQGFATASDVETPFEVYKVGVIRPDGEFYVKAESSYDFAEAFANDRKYMDTRDPVWLRHEFKEVSEAEAEPAYEQVEMFG